MTRWWVGVVMLVAISSIAAPVSARTIGVVLMHGNTDTPSGTVAPLAAVLENAGYLVERPEMCWSYRRRLDRPFLDCLQEIDASIARLTQRGARAIVVAGMSEGGIAALAFGARHPGLAGIIALAPAGAPERLVAVFPLIAQSVAAARAMVAAGHGNERASFNDLNIRGPFLVSPTAAIYLSFFDPTGPANMLDSRLKEPLLWVAGTADRSQRETRDIFSHAPANPLNRYVTVSADHLGTPTAAEEAVLAWLRELR